MWETIIVVVRALALACRRHHELVLENLALRQWLTALRRTVQPPTCGAVVHVPHLGGLHHHDERRAA